MKRFLLSLIAFLALAASDSHAATYKLLHAFTGGKTDGRTPTIESSLTPSGPDFYGVTLDGGQFTNGVVFQISTNGGATKLLHTFNGWSVLNQAASKNDGAYPVGTPILAGNTLYGMTESGGSNGPGFGLGTIYSVNTNGTGFQILHHFGAQNDGYFPQGSLIQAGSTLFGMTSEGGTNGISEGIVFSMETNGSNYQILLSLTGSPAGSLILWGTTLYGMTAGEIFRVETNGSGYHQVHQFTGAPYDGAAAFGSLTRSDAYLYGMTSTGGANNLGCIFQLYLIGSQFHLLHSFAFTEANSPHGDLALSGPTLYGMSYGGVTNLGRIGDLGSGAVFEINTNGSDYQLLHTFEFPIVANDGSLPFGTPLVIGNELYGMTSLGGSAADGGCIFSLSITPYSETQPPTITNTTPLPTGNLGVAYKQQLGAIDGVTPYAFALASGQLPKGLTLSAAGLLSGKPTVGDVATFSLKVTDKNKLTSTQSFTLTIIAPPTLTITAPKANEKVTVPTLTVSGTATGTPALAGVYFQLNGGAWTKAETGSTAAEWNYPNLPLLADTNIFRAYAEDTLGNKTTTNSITFTYYTTTALKVTTTGSGSFAPPDNGVKLQVGATFPITAKPAKGFVFSDWTDGNGNILSQAAALKFVMASNLTLVANFVAAPKPALALNSSVTYSGLFAPSPASRQNTNAGAIHLTLTAADSYSGQLILGPDTLPFSGQFNPSGATQIFLARKGKNNLTAMLHLDSELQTISGQVTDGIFVAALTADSNAGDSSVQTTNYQGHYNVTIRLANDPFTATTPASVDVDASGNVTFAAVLPDGTLVTQTSLVSPDGSCPIYAPLYDGRGSLWLWTQFSNGKIASVPASADWFTPSNTVVPLALQN